MPLRSVCIEESMLGSFPRCYPFVDGTSFHTLTAALATTLPSISISTYISKYLWLQRLGVYIAIVHSLVSCIATLDGTPWTGNRPERDTNVSFLTHKLDTLSYKWPPLKGLTSSIYMHKLRTMLAYDSWTDQSEFHGKNIEYIAVRIRAHTNRIWRTKDSFILD